MPDGEGGAGVRHGGAGVGGDDRHYRMQSNRFND